jgi:arylamine N-acetyltransferase
MASRQKFDRKQVAAYFDRLKLPPHEQQYHVSGLSTDQQLSFLSLLHKQHLRTIPFENLELHYSRHRLIDVSVPKIFDKIISSSGRGGYCVESNLLFNTLLLSLGYEAYLVPSRVYEPLKQQYLALTHCLNIVIIGNDQYAVDVGFGGNVTTIPLRLVNGAVQPLAHTMQARVRFGTIPEGLSPRTEYWIYEYRPSQEGSWAVQYCFLDFEILPQDLVAMNLSPSTSRTSFFTYRIICLKFTTSKEFHSWDMANGDFKTPEEPAKWDENDRIDGVLIMDGATLKWRKGGVKQWEITMKSEEERIRALERLFAIHLSCTEKDAIQGSVSALPSGPGKLSM